MYINIVMLELDLYLLHNLHNIVYTYVYINIVMLELGQYLLRNFHNIVYTYMYINSYVTARPIFIT
jgi:hypothetical protein